MYIIACVAFDDDEGAGANVTVSASVQDVKLLLEQNKTVTFTVRSDAEDSMRLSFNWTEEGVIRPIGDVEVEGPKARVRVKLVATGAGKTVLCADAEVEEGGVKDGKAIRYGIITSNKTIVTFKSLI